MQDSTVVYARRVDQFVPRSTHAFARNGGHAKAKQEFHPEEGDSHSPRACGVAKPINFIIFLDRPKIFFTRLAGNLVKEIVKKSEEHFSDCVARSSLI